MRDDDRVRILHMIDATDSLAQFVAGRKRGDLDTDRMLLFAIVRAIEVVGEAASKVTVETRDAAPGVPSPDSHRGFEIPCTFDAALTAPLSLLTALVSCKRQHT